MCESNLDARKKTRRLVGLPVFSHYGSLHEITAANTIRRWLKNEAKTGESWKYAHYKSHSSRTQKRAVLVACLRKIHLMANDVGGLYFSAIKKLKEFENLDYPVGMLRNACNRLGATTGEGAWIGIRNRL